jgi:hypothetical protein
VLWRTVLPYACFCRNDSLPIAELLRLTDAEKIAVGYTNRQVDVLVG